MAEINNDRIKNFQDISCWQEAHDIALSIYQLTLKFPEDEKFALTNQMRRAAVSIASNIAEGFSRHTKNDKIHFYNIAQGSLTELHNQLIFSKDLGYIDSKQYDLIIPHIELEGKLLFGFIKGAEKLAR